MPYNSAKLNRRIVEAYGLRARNRHEAGSYQSLRRKQELSSLRMFSLFAHSSTLKMETVCSSITSVEFHQTTRSYPICLLKTGETAKHRSVEP
jgi:hypothetical protein